MIELCVLGGLDLRGSEGEAVVPILAQPKRAALLAYLAVATPRGFHRRDKLLGLFWPERDSEHARGALRNALYFLRQSLGEGVVVSRGAEEVGLAADAVLCDAVAFEAALDEGRTEEALDLYRGDLLEGFFISEAPEFEHWLDRERERLRGRAAEAAWTLVEREQARGNGVEAASWARRAVSFTPNNEAAFRRLLELLDRLGNRTGAIEMYEAFARRWQQDYEAEPSPETQALIAFIREREAAVAGEYLARPVEYQVAEALLSPEVRWTLAAKRLRARRRKLAAAAARLLVVLLGAGAVWHWVRGEAEVPVLVVLPFEVFGVAEGDNVVRGVSEEIRSRLVAIDAVSVRGRLSARQARESGWAYGKIGDELDVDYVVDGSIWQQDDEGRVSVRAELIRVSDATSVWEQSYDPVGPEDFLQAQISIAQSILEAMGLTPRRDEAEVLTRRYTQDPEAYQLYQRGRQYLRRPGSLLQNLESAQQLYESALAIDPEFALAYAGLSEVHGQMHWFRYDLSAARVAQQREAAEAALRLEPELPEAHLAMGLWLYWGELDYERALAELEVAARGRPNDPYVWAYIGYVHRRLGNWVEVLAAFEKATELDPLDAELFVELGGYNYVYLRRYADGVRAFDRALTLAPDFHEATYVRGLAYALWQGQLDSLRSALERVPTGADLGWAGSWTAQHLHLLYLERQADSLLSQLLTARVRFFEGGLLFPASPLYAAWAHQLRGDRPAARAAFDSALVLVDSVLTERPGDWRVHAARGHALAGLGRREGALREARWLQESEVYRYDKNFGTWLAEHRAWILAQAGEADAAIDELERLLERPSYVSVPKVRLDPLWDPLRDHPRFQALLEQYE